MVKVTCGFMLAQCHPLSGLGISSSSNEGIAERIRAFIMLPARQLVKPNQNLCDSSLNGPFCGFLGSQPASVVTGLIYNGLWNYSSRSDDIARLQSVVSQINFPDLPTPPPREFHITHLDRATHLFGPYPLSPLMLGFSEFRLDESASGIILFDEELVTVISLHLRSDRRTCLVRGAVQSRAVWARLVQPGEVLDVSLPSEDIDPSLSGIDKIELFGAGCEILDLSVSVSPNRTPPQVRFLISADLEHPSRYFGAHAFPDSAYLIDMNRAIREGWKFSAEPLTRIPSAFEHYTFSLPGVTEFLRRCPPGLEAEIDQLLKQAKSRIKFESFSSILLAQPARLMLALLSPPGPSTARCSSQISQLSSIPQQGQSANYEVDGMDSENNVRGEQPQELALIFTGEVSQEIMVVAAQVIERLVEILGEGNFLNIFKKIRNGRKFVIDQTILKDLIIEGLGMIIMSDQDVESILNNAINELTQFKVNSKLVTKLTKMLMNR
jgi:hypothetical protein